jgi:drug/metabolite transporter (DMT)-like permease
MAADAWKAHAALLLVQLNYGAYHVIAKLALTGGINQLVFCVLRDVVALTILGPLAYIKDKGSRPALSGYILFSFFFLGLTGIFGNQLLFTLGLNFTSPAYAAALQPAIPVFTFLLALAFGAENANWQRIDGKAKILGVLVCVAGALIMALYKGPALLGDGFSDLNLQGIAVAGKPAPEPIGWLATLLIDAGVELWHLGVVCLVGNCFCMASYIVYQRSLQLN